MGQTIVIRRWSLAVTRPDPDFRLQGTVAHCEVFSVPAYLHIIENPLKMPYTRTSLSLQESTLSTSSESDHHRNCSDLIFPSLGGIHPGSLVKTE